MAREPKTKRTRASVSAFLDAVEDDAQRKQARRLATLMRSVTGKRPAMWGPSIVGFGEYPSTSGPWPRAGFSPRKGSLVIYVMPGTKTVSALLKRLGPHKTGAVCLYVKSLDEIDEGVLRDVIARGWKTMGELHPE
ncbi:MAG: DUF1801 domain-containing protein [Myxococcaceae bacterium]|nr:DUF1801 domain-containing protein [Myxococcaceae bacterium]